MRCGSWRRRGFSPAGPRPEALLSNRLRADSARRGADGASLASEGGRGQVGRLPPPGPVVAKPVDMTSSLKRLLVATDFSEASDEASQPGHRARQAGRRVRWRSSTRGARQRRISLRADLSRKTSAASSPTPIWGSRFARPASPPRSAVSLPVPGGHPGQGDCPAGRETKADLIVIATHGRRGLAHAVLGSVAERVVQHAGCPSSPFPSARKRRRRYHGQLQSSRRTFVVERSLPRRGKQRKNSGRR